MKLKTRSWSLPKRCAPLWKRVNDLSDEAQKAGWESTSRGRKLMAQSDRLEHEYERLGCKGTSIKGELVFFGVVGVVILGGWWLVDRLEKKAAPEKGVF